MKRSLLVLAGLLGLAGVAYAWQTVGPAAPAFPLRTVGDYALTGNANRFDYASMDDERHVLWLAHMGDGSVEAFDVKANHVTLTVPLAPQASVRGILAGRGRVYAAAQGLGVVVVLDGLSGRRIARVPAGDVDGLAYDPITQRIFVSDESGGRDTVIDTRSNRKLGAIVLGGEAGNTQYDPVSRHIFVGVQSHNELAEVDPATLTIVRRYPLPGCQWSHSVSIDAQARAAYIGCQRNVRLVRLDLKSGHVTGSGGVGVGVDVLALDGARHRLYVASESGIVSVYDVSEGGLRRVAQGFLAPSAHVVAVDQATHRVYFPLQNVAGKPVMRVMEPL